MVVCLTALAHTSGDTGVLKERRGVEVTFCAHTATQAGVREREARKEGRRLSATVCLGTESATEDAAQASE